MRETLERPDNHDRATTNSARARNIKNGIATLVYDPIVPSARAVLDLVRHLRGRTTASLKLDSIAARAGWSPFHLHRAFRAVVGEKPKQYNQRLRLERAASRLLLNDDSVLTVALNAGFNSHEVFTRAFAGTSVARRSPTEPRRSGMPRHQSSIGTRRSLKRPARASGSIT